MTTNYERIKNMTLEEMAKLLNSMTSCNTLILLNGKGLCDTTENNFKLWLQQEMRNK